MVWERIIPYVVETFPTEHTPSTKHPNGFAQWCLGKMYLLLTLTYSKDILPSDEQNFPLHQPASLTL